MCGIAGFAGKGDPDILKSMTDLIAHRGPDGEGFLVDDPRRVYLGHRRLAIIDIAGGHQPMWSHDRTLCIVFNGEIYNHAEIRAELVQRGHSFLTDHSDTEVLLCAYREWGSAMTARLNGMWAFVLLDVASQTLFCSRDRFGKKPFYYALEAGTFVFSSELKSLRAHPCVRREIDERALKKYFAYGYIPAPLALYKGVRKLPGGYSLTFDLRERSLLVERYWDFRIEPMSKVPDRAEETWCEQIRELLDRAVQRRLMSDVPLGVFLSGGVDSSAVTAFAARHTPKGLVKTFSIGFEEESFDESGYAARVARHLGADHHVEILSAEKGYDLTSFVAGALDEPMADSSLLPVYLLSRFTRKHVTVALGGDGADELFGGYATIRALRLAEIYRRFVPRPVHDAVAFMAARIPVSFDKMSFDFKVKRMMRGVTLRPALWNPAWMASMTERDMGNLFGSPVDLEDVFSEAIELWEGSAHDNVYDKTLEFQTKVYMQGSILTKVDRASMMTSLEVRAPFLDIDLVNLARRIPHQYKLRRGQTKYILKKALEPVLPRDILYRAKKGFNPPIGGWFHRGDLSLPEDVSYPHLEKAAIQQKYEAHRRGQSDEKELLWSLLIYRAALDSTVPGSVPASVVASVPAASVAS